MKDIYIKFGNPLNGKKIEGESRDNEHNMTLYRRFPGGTEREVAKAGYIASDANRNDPDTPSSCDELYAQYLAKHAASKQ